MSFAFLFRNTLKEGRISMIHTILSAEIWQPLGKLTYSMYLFHVSIIDWWTESITMTQYYTFWFVIFIFCGFWFLTFISALILWFIMEQPIANVVGLFRKWLSGVNVKSNRKARLHDSAMVNELPKQDEFDQSLLKQNHEIYEYSENHEFQKN